jgi:predicted transcriptional regulator
MQRTIPEAWHDLSGWERDVLVTLAVDGPATGYKIAERIDPTAQRSQSTEPLNKLIEKGFVKRNSPDVPQNGYTNKLTTEGLALVHESIVQPAIEIDGSRNG